MGRVLQVQSLPLNSHSLNAPFHFADEIAVDFSRIALDYVSAADVSSRTKNQRFHCPLPCVLSVSVGSSPRPFSVPPAVCEHVVLLSPSSFLTGIVAGVRYLSLPNQVQAGGKERADGEGPEPLPLPLPTITARLSSAAFSCFAHRRSLRAFDPLSIRIDQTSFARCGVWSRFPRAVIVLGCAECIDRLNHALPWLLLAESV
ncbi:hypothetical protein Y032_0013g1941 [Ancylostoma ceylanicum]|nr:hypothetical protein Y032_0013g1941 [Ancylostoma ceylanicum]